MHKVCIKYVYMRRLHRGSGINASVPAAQPRQKYHFARLLFCLGYNFIKIKNGEN